MRGFISLLLLAGFFHTAIAQSGFAPRQFVRSPVALPWQPAAAGFQPAGQTTVTLTGQAGYGTNSLPLSLLPVYGDPLVLDSAFAATVTTHMGDGPLLGQESLESGLWVTRALKGRMFTVALRQQQSLGGRVDDPQMARLMLHTNAGIDSLYEQGLNAWLSNSYALSFGMAVIQRDSFSLGVRLNLLGGTAFTSLRPTWLRYAYLREPVAEEIRLSAQYALFRATGGGLPGLGASLDAGAVWQTGPWTLQASFSGLGGMHWTGEQYEDSVEIAFSGVTFPSSDTTWADSMLALIRPDTISTTLFQALMPTLHASAQYQSSTGWTGLLAASWAVPSRISQQVNPQLALGLGKSSHWGKNRRQQTDLLVTAAAGGLTGFSLGATVQHCAAWGEEKMIRVFLSLDDYGLLNPGKTTYTGGSAGISVGW